MYNKSKIGANTLSTLCSKQCLVSPPSNRHPTDNHDQPCVAWTILCITSMFYQFHPSLSHKFFLTIFWTDFLSRPSSEARDLEYTLIHFILLYICNFLMEACTLLALDKCTVHTYKNFHISIYLWYLFKYAPLWFGSQDVVCITKKWKRQANCRRYTFMVSIGLCHYFIWRPIKLYENFLHLRWGTYYWDI